MKPQEKHRQCTVKEKSRELVKTMMGVRDSN